MRMGSLKRIAGHCLLATVAVFAMGAMSVPALTVPGTSGMAQTPVTVNVPTVRVPSTAPTPPPAPKVSVPAPVKVPSAPVVKQVTKPVTNVVTKTVPKTTGTVKQTVPKTTGTVKQTVPKVTNPVKQTTGTAKKTITGTAKKVSGGGPPSGPGGPTVSGLSGTAGKVTGTVRNGLTAIGGSSAGLVNSTTGTRVVGGASGLATSGSGSTAGSSGFVQTPNGMVYLGGPGGGPGGPGGGSSGGGFFGGSDFPGGSAGMGGGGSLAAMLAGASPEQLRSVLAHLEGCLPALPAIDRQVITMRAGVNGTPLTRPQVGARLGLSRQAVRNTERRALNRLQYANANTGCGGTLVGPFDVAGIGNLTPQLLFAGAVPVSGSMASLTAGTPTGDLTQTRGILPRATDSLFDLGGGGGSGPAWAIILFTVLFSVSIAALTRELRNSF